MRKTPIKSNRKKMTPEKGEMIHDKEKTKPQF